MRLWSCFEMFLKRSTVLWVDFLRVRFGLLSWFATIFSDAVLCVDFGEAPLVLFWVFLEGIHDVTGGWSFSGGVCELIT